MNDKQQTAVDLFAERTFNLIELMKRRYVNQEEFLDGMLKARNEANERHKEQIAKAFDDGECNYFYSRKTGNDFADGQEYFNELYGEEQL